MVGLRFRGIDSEGGLKILLRNFFKQKIYNWAVKSLTSKNEEDRFFLPRETTASTLRNPQDFLNSFQFITYVGHACSLIAGDIASLNWQIVNNEGKEVSAPEIEELFNSPIPASTWYEFIYQSVLHILLDGNVFWLLDSTNALSLTRKSFNEIKTLNPATVEIIDIDGEEVRSTTSTNVTRLRHYRVDVTTTRGSIVIEPEKVIQSKFTSPHNMIRGMGKIQQTANHLEVDRFTSIFNNTFFAQGAKMDFALTPPAEMGPKEFNMYEKKIREKYEGQKNWNKIFLAPPGSKVQTMNLSQKDMELIEQKKMTRQDVYGLFNIPPIISNIMEDSKFDSVEVQKAKYFQLDLPRVYTPLQFSLSKIVSRLKPGLFFRFIQPQVIDSEKQNAIAKDMFDRAAITGNQYRKMVGQNEDPEKSILNTHFISTNLLPADPSFIEESEKSLTYEKKASQRQLRLHFIARLSKKRIEKEIDKNIRKFYDQLEKRIIAGLEKSWDSFDKKDANITDAFDLSTELQEARKDAQRFFTSTAALAVNDVNKFFSLDIDPSTRNPQLQLVVEKLKVRYADLTINSRRDEVRKLLEDGVAEGLSISEIKGQIQDHFQTLKVGPQGWRATRIARTEASYAWDQVASLGYKQLRVTKVDVVGCEDVHEPWDCNKTGFPLSQITSLNFHPNHTGTVVPSNI